MGLLIQNIRPFYIHTKNINKNNIFEQNKLVKMVQKLHWLFKFYPGKQMYNAKTTNSDQVCQWFATCWWFSPGTPISSTNKTDRHNIAEILLKVALNTITITPKITKYRNEKTNNE